MGKNPKISVTSVNQQCGITAHTVRLIAVPVIIAGILTACFSSGPECPSDPIAAARDEAAIVRTLVHKENTSEAMFKTLTARGYQCGPAPTTDVMCQKTVCRSSKYRCDEDVIVQRYKNRDQFSVDAFESGTYCRIGH